MAKQKKTAEPKQPEQSEKNKVGRPKSEDKKIQFKLYSTAKNKQKFEQIAFQYGLTASQLFELVVTKLDSAESKTLSKFLDKSPVSPEEQDKMINRKFKKTF